MYLCALGMGILLNKSFGFSTLCFFGLRLDDFKSIRILHALSDCSETRYTSSTHQYSAFYSSSFSHRVRANIESAILSLHSKSVSSRPLSSTPSFSPPWRLTVLIFGDVSRMSVFSLPFKFVGNWPTCSPMTARGFAPCPTLDSEYTASTCV